MALFLLGGCEGELKPTLPAPPQLTIPQQERPNPQDIPAVSPMLRPPAEIERCQEERGYVAPMVIRRLTRTEYENTARELLGVEISSLTQGFPPEEEVNGFDNQSKSLQVSALHVEQYLQASEQLAGLVAQRFDTLSPCVPMSPEDPESAEACVLRFIEEFGRRAWRRPLTADETTTLLELYRAGVTGAREDLALPNSHLLGEIDPFQDGVTLLASALFQSPHFLYRVELGADLSLTQYRRAEDEATQRAPGEVRELTDYELASRLSYLLWRSMPDAELFAIAEAGRLSEPEVLTAQAERMVLDPRASEGLWSFFEQWLAIDEVSEISKEAQLFPGYSVELNELLETEARLFIEDIVFEKRDMRQLFNSSTSFMNAKLATHYARGGEGAELPRDQIGRSPEWSYNVDPELSDVQRAEAATQLPRGERFERVHLNPQRRSGILTRGAVLALTTKPNMGDPVHRGLYIRERLLCTPLPPPPPDIVVVAPDPDPSLTTREQFSIHSSEPTCAGCHRLVDPLGFGLERFDPVGRFRGLENGKEIDDSGEVVSTLDLDGPFNGSAELAEKLASSEQVQRCVVVNLLRYAHGRSETAPELCDIDALYKDYERSGYDMLSLLRAVVNSENFRYLHLDASPSESVANDRGAP